MSTLPPRPAWLEDEPEIEALLREAVAAFDRQPGEQRQRALHLPAQRLPLARGDGRAEDIWKLVRELERLGVLIIRRTRHHVLDPDWTGAKLAFAPGSEPVLREWLGLARKEDALQVWRREVLAREKDFPGGCEALLARRVEIAGRGPAEVVDAFARIARLGVASVTLRQLSASVFWGDSKQLDARGDLIAALFPQLIIRERAIPVSVFLPQEVKGVLFIENQDTYTAALGGFPGECAELALVYASGFKASARYIRTRGKVVLHYAGPGVARWQAGLEGWWLDKGPALGPVCFWGDLDFSGMQILKALRERFEGLSAWKCGYGPMLAALKGRGGHRGSEEPAEGGQADPQYTGCPFADEELLPAIRQHGQIDQELLCEIAAALWRVS